MKIFYTKKDRQRIEGLVLLEEGIKVRLRAAEWHLKWDNLSEKERACWKYCESFCHSMLNQIQEIWDGKLHY